MPALSSERKARLTSRNHFKYLDCTDIHTSDFIFNAFWNGKPLQFIQERPCWLSGQWPVAGYQKNESCSNWILNFLERLDDRIRCTHEETVAVVKPWEDIGSNKSLGCVFSEKPADWSNAFKLEISRSFINWSPSAYRTSVWFDSITSVSSLFF